MGRQKRLNKQGMGGQQTKDVKRLTNWAVVILVLGGLAGAFAVADPLGPPPTPPELRGWKVERVATVFAPEPGSWSATYNVRAKTADVLAAFQATAPYASLDPIPQAGFALRPAGSDAPYRSVVAWAGRSYIPSRSRPMGDSQAEQWTTVQVARKPRAWHALEWSLMDEWGLFGPSARDDVQSMAFEGHIRFPWSPKKPIVDLAEARRFARQKWGDQKNQTE